MDEEADEWRAGRVQSVQASDTSETSKAPKGEDSWIPWATRSWVIRGDPSIEGRAVPQHSKVWRVWRYLVSKSLEEHPWGTGTRMRKDLSGLLDINRYSNAYFPRRCPPGRTVLQCPHHNHHSAITPPRGLLDKESKKLFHGCLFFQGLYPDKPKSQVNILSPSKIF